jgi:hypothetical protein
LLAGAVEFAWDKTNKLLNIGGTVAGAKISLALRNSSNNAAASNELQIGNDAAANALDFLVGSSGYTNANNWAFIYNKVNGPLILGNTNPAGQLVISAAGNVGIGTTAPTAKLHLVDNAVGGGNSFLATTTSLSTGNFVQLTENGTLAGANQTVLNILSTNANGSGVLTYGLQVTNTHTGAGSTDVAGFFLADSAPTNVGVRVGNLAGATSNIGYDLVSLANGATGIGLQIGTISAATTATGISIGAISGGATGTGIATGTNSSTGANVYQLNLGQINGNGVTTGHYGINIGAISGTVSNAYGMDVGTITGGTTADYGIYINSITTNGAANSYGIYTGILAGSGTTTYGVYVATPTSTGTTNYGYYVGAVSGSTSKYAFYSNGLTSTGAATNNIGFYLGAISGSTAGTTNTGMQIVSVGGTATNNYGINIGTIAGGTTSNVAMVTGAVSGVATNNYQLNLNSVTGGSGSNTIILTGAVSGAATNNYGLNLGTVTGGTTANYGINLGAVTVTGSANSYGLNVAGLVGVGSTSFGINVLASTTTGAADYGMRITGPTGAATSNYGLNVLMPTSATTHNAGIEIGAVSVTPGTWALYSSAANNSYFAGNLGLGTSSPGALLDVKGTMRLSSATTTAFIGLVAPTSAIQTTYILPNDGSSGQLLMTNGVGTLSWTTYSIGTGMTNVLTTKGDMIYSSGGAVPARLMLGTNNQCLIVASSAPIWANCPGGSTAAGSDTQIQFNNATAFGADSSFTWNNTNKTLGVGGTVVGAKISIALLNSSGGATSTDEFRLGNDTNPDALRIWVNSSGFTNAANFVSIFNKANAPIILGTNNTERMRLDGSGNLGIGATSPGAKLHSLATTEQLRLGYDPTDYNSFTVGSTGSLTVAATGTNPNIILTPGGTGFTLLNGAVGMGIVAPTASRLHIVDNIVAAGNSVLVSTNSLTTGNLVQLNANTVNAGANQTILNIIDNGANNAGSITTYGLQVSNTHTGISPTNYAAAFSASGGATNYGVQINNMAGSNNYGMNIGTLSGSLINIGVQIGNISAGATTDAGISIGTVAGGGTGSAITTNTVSSTGANAYQLYLGGGNSSITGNNSTAHYGINMGAISGVTPIAYGINIGTVTGGTTTGNYGVNVGAINSTYAATSYGVAVQTMTGSGAAKYGVYVGGLTSNNLSTNAGVYVGALSGSTGASTNSGLQVASIAGVATNAYGLNIGTITGAITGNYGVNVGAITSTGATNSYGMAINSAMVGTGTNKYGFYLAGITSSTQSTNVGLYLGTIQSSIGASTNAAIQTANLSGAATNNYGLNIGTVTGGTTGNYEANFGTVTSIAGANNYGIVVGGTTGTAAASNNYGMLVSTMNSTGNGNYGLNILQPSGATHNAALELGVAAGAGTPGTWALFSSSANPSFFAGNVGIGMTSPTYLFQTYGGNVGIGPSNAASAAQLRLFEGSTGGSDYIAIKAADSINSPFTLTLPAALGLNGQVLQTDASGNLTWAANAASGMNNPMTSAGDLIYGSGPSGNPMRLGIGTTAQCLVVSATLVPSWGACNGAAAGGSNTQVIYNGSGVYSGAAEFTWDNTNKTLGVGGTVNGAKVSIAIRNSSANATATNELQIGNDNAANALSLLVDSSAFTGYVNNANIFNRTASGSLNFGTNSTERMRILSGGNVGIGTTNPLALFDVNGVAAFGAGLVGTPSITFRTNLTTGIWQSAANIFNISTNGSERLRIDASGNVGINNVAPAAVFDVGGTAWLRGVSAGTLGVYVKSDGTVGIGTTAPATQLDVNGVAGFSLGTLGAPGIAFRGNLNTGIWSSGANTLNVSTNGTERFRVDTNGNLGLGNTGPVALLDVGGTTWLRGALSGTAGMFVKNGVVGIGTTNPSSQLQITATAAPTVDQMNITNVGYANINPSISNLSLNYVGGSAAVEAEAEMINLIAGSLTGGTWDGLRIVAGSAPVAGENENGIKIDPIVTGAGTQTAINIGSGWNYGIYDGAIINTANNSSYAMYGIGITGAANSVNIGFSLGAIGGTAISGSTTTSTNAGIHIGNISSVSGTGSNYGIYMENISGPTNNSYGINLGTLTGGVITNTGINVGLISGTAANNYGINLSTLTGGTSTNAQINIGAVTAIAGATDYGINIAGITGTAASSANYGLNVNTLNSAGAANYGVYISQPSGSTHNVALEIGTAAATTTGTWALYSSSAQNSYFAGNVGIGTSSPTGLFQVGIGATTPLFVSTGGNVGIGTTNPAYALDLLTAGTAVARFGSTSGYSSCSFLATGVLSCSSDINLKKNITNSSYGLDTVMSLRPVEYNWKYETDGTAKNIGFIAQEVQKVMPNLVTTDASGYEELNTIGMVPVLTEAIQQQQLAILDMQNKGGTSTQKIKDIDSQLSLVNDDYDKLNKDINDLRGKLEKNASDIQGLEVTMGSDVKVVTDSLVALKSQTDELKNISDDHESRIKNLEDQLVAMEEKNSSSGLNISGSNAASSEEIDKLTTTVSGTLVVADLVAQNIKADKIEGLEFIQSDISAIKTDDQNNTDSVNNLGQEVSDIKDKLASLSLNWAGGTGASGLTADTVKNMESQGALVIGGPVEFRGPAVFKTIADFFDKVVFHNKVQFANEVSFNQDAAGYALIKKGGKVVDVTFQNEYSNVPVVNATLSIQEIKDEELRQATEDLVLNSDVKYVITNVTTKGFQIKIENSMDWDIPFSWQAVSVKDPKTFGEGDDSADSGGNTTSATNTDADLNIGTSAPMTAISSNTAPEEDAISVGNSAPETIPSVDVSPNTNNEN